MRYRQRYLDLMANEETREVFAHPQPRSSSAIRRFLDAAASWRSRRRCCSRRPAARRRARSSRTTTRSTRTSSCASSLELYLKRLLVGGFDRVYEIGRIFRNEGIDRKHNPEFTMLESYEAYADYNDVMAMVEEMVSHRSHARCTGTTQVRFGEHEIDLAPPWRRLTMRDALIEHAGIDFEEFRTREALRDGAAAARHRRRPGAGRGAS